MKVKSFHLLLFLGMTALLLSSCDKKSSNPLDTDYNQPFVSWIAVTPDNIDTDTILVNRQSLPTDLITITTTIESKVTHITGISQIGDVSFQLYFPGASSSVAQGRLVAGTPPPSITLQPNEAYYSATVSFRVSRVKVGNLYVRVQAESKEGVEGNSSQHRIFLHRASRAPIISDVSAPDTIILPSSGYREFVISVAVSDSDGLGDIDMVFFRNLDSQTDTNKQYFLYDDGVQYGQQYDLIANDGIYTCKFSIPWNATPKTYHFVFEAIDQLDYISNRVVHEIVVRH